MSDETTSTKPRTPERLAATIHALTTFEHDGGGGGYGESADALWKAATLAFDYVARELGVTGFQASWAALRFYAEVMHVEGPFALFKAHDALYPQYDMPARLRRYLDVEWTDWLADEAAKRLAEYEAKPTLTYTDDDGQEVTAPAADPRVVEHWRGLVAARKAAVR